MKTVGWTLALGIPSAALLLACGWLTLQLAELKIRLAHAEAQTEIFEAMREQALRSDAQQAVASLNYAVNYYPSGTKQVPGSKLDRMVERHRSCVISEIISYLRAKTGKDLGSNPQAWIDAYSPEQEIRN